jgi:hypothetical protein
MNNRNKGGVNVENLADKINGAVEVDQNFIEEYFKRNERKKEDDKWIKEKRRLVIKELQKLEKDVVDYGDIRVSMVIPDTSNFDKEKVLEFVETKGIKSKVVKEELDEDKLMQLIEEGLIDIDELKKYAWIESTGNPRITLKELKR